MLESVVSKFQEARQEDETSPCNTATTYCKKAWETDPGSWAEISLVYRVPESPVAIKPEGDPANFKVGGPGEIYTICWLLKQFIKKKKQNFNISFISRNE